MHICKPDPLGTPVLCPLGRVAGMRQNTNAFGQIKPDGPQSRGDETFVSPLA